MVLLNSCVATLLLSFVLFLVGTQFANTASEILRVTQQNAVKTASSLQGFAALYPAYANQVPDSQLPYILLRDFEAFAGNARAVSRASVLAFAP